MVKVLIFYYNIRGVGGFMYFIGFIIFVYNIFMIIIVGKKLECEFNYVMFMFR